MTDNAMKRALARTFDRTVCVYRPKDDGTEETVYIDARCALSRAAQVSAPVPPRFGAALTESRYALALYTAPEIVLRLGDRAVISDGAGRSYHARSSDSVRYPSHCVTVVEVQEVTLPVGQDSQEETPEAPPAAEGGEA